MDHITVIDKLCLLLALYDNCFGKCRINRDNYTGYILISHCEIFTFLVGQTI